MKRLLFVVIAFVFILAACGNNSSKDKEASKDSKTINVGTEGLMHHLVSMIKMVN